MPDLNIYVQYWALFTGGLRFKDNIESAFKRQGFMLSQCIRRLEKIQSQTNIENGPAPREDLLRALWHRSRELHYAAHFREPLDIEIGDIGYITLCKSEKSSAVK